MPTTSKARSHLRDEDVCILLTKNIYIIEKHNIHRYSPKVQPQPEDGLDTRPTNYFSSISICMARTAPNSWRDDTVVSIDLTSSAPCAGLPRANSNAINEPLRVEISHLCMIQPLCSYTAKDASQPTAKRFGQGICEYLTTTFVAFQDRRTPAVLSRSNHRVFQLANSDDISSDVGRLGWRLHCVLEFLLVVLSPLGEGLLNSPENPRDPSISRHCRYIPEPADARLP